MKTLAVFTGSDLRAYGGGEKDVPGWAGKINDFEVALCSPLYKSHVRLTMQQVEDAIPRQVHIKYFRAIRLTHLRELPLLSVSGNKTLIGIRNSQAVYSMHQGILFNTILLFTCKFFNVKFVLGIHLAIPLEDKQIESTTVKRLLNRFFVFERNFLIRHTRYIWVQNTRDTRNLELSGLRGKIYNIPPFIDVGNPSLATEANDSTFICLFVGRLSVRQKGLDLLGEIITTTLRENSDLRVVILGSERDGESIVTRLTILFPDNVVWKGFVGEDELIEEYKRPSFFIFPSRGENFGISLVEVQAHGLAAVAFRVMGVEDVVYNGAKGDLVKPFDVSAFSKSILKYYSVWKSDRDTYLSIKRDIATNTRKRFDVSKMLNDLEKMFSG